VYQEVQWNYIIAALVFKVMIIVVGGGFYWITTVCTGLFVWTCGCVTVCHGVGVLVVFDFWGGDVRFVVVALPLHPPCPGFSVGKSHLVAAVQAPISPAFTLQVSGHGPQHSTNLLV
jgi:hypothetical protein